jgi:hypothetical protein
MSEINKNTLNQYAVIPGIICEFRHQFAQIFDGRIRNGRIRDKHSSDGYLVRYKRDRYKDVYI